ncbi:GNAT domain-containing protein [Annulohypoxylon truncatum]|uniref:GNAT domain-containing protein n=1 Tax=Annulohypoxylon truncatum TaxID=327061 RepID=UPI002007EF02|nr:GNAT domain-containing protein [Annulohypoxylon truncatum]KAI1214648.1 GNAT domain-containing protein [Annulohypoxylon truncatum]
MRVNQEVAVCGNSIILVPYEKHHVPTYHQWMEDEKLRQATASEPLTLNQEYEMQESWRTTCDKLTFIICEGAPFSGLEDELSPVIAGQVDIPDTMTGDVNMFLSPWIPDNEEEMQMVYDESETKTYCTAEIDIMIADPARRGKGLGRAAVATFMRYVLQNLEAILHEYDGFHVNDDYTHRKVVLKEMAAKIYEDNAASIALFKSLGFKQRGGVNYFGEVELVLDDFGEDGFELKGPIGELVGMGYKEVEYDRSMLQDYV